MTFRSIYEGLDIAYSIDRNVDLTPNMALTIVIEHEKRGYRPLGMTFRSIYEGLDIAYSIDRNVEVTPNMALAIGIEHE